MGPALLFNFKGYIPKWSSTLFGLSYLITFAQTAPPDFFTWYGSDFSFFLIPPRAILCAIVPFSLFQEADGYRRNYLDSLACPLLVEFSQWEQL